MYQSAKKTLHRLLPKSLMFRLEPALRYVFSRTFVGEEYHCPVCESNWKKFIVLQNGNKVCPKCGSGGRERRLWTLLQDYIGQNTTQLDFSPARSLFRRLKKINNHTYVASDLSGDFLADEAFDITRIDAPNEAFDLITCYHILEHVPEDERAMTELYRVLKKEGVCFVQTPFKNGAIYENPDINTPQERLEHFGQEDHVRIYSVQGLKERLSKVGFRIEQLSFDEKESNRFGFKTQETVLVCRK